jgi:predicted ester cyclase
MKPIESNAIRSFTRIFKNEHNVDAIDHLFAPDFKHNFPPPRTPGLPGFKELGRAFNHAFPDVVVVEQDLIATPDKVVERSSVVGTHKGDLMGIPATNRAIHWTKIHIYRFTNGNIAEHWVEMSML